MKYREAVRSDVNRLVDLRIEYLIEDFGNLKEATELKIRENLPGYFSEHLGRDLKVYLAETERKEIVGTVFFIVTEKPSSPAFITGKTGTVLNVYVKKEYRRQGIGKCLIEMMLQEAKEKSLDFVELKATKDGYCLYEKMGFVETGKSYIPMKYNIMSSWDLF